MCTPSARGRFPLIDRLTDITLFHHRRPPGRYESERVSVSMLRLLRLRTCEQRRERRASGSVSNQAGVVGCRDDWSRAAGLARTNKPVAQRQHLNSVETFQQSFAQPSALFPLPPTRSVLTFFSRPIFGVCGLMRPTAAIIPHFDRSLSS
jgi:hypothetical protein